MTLVTLKACNEIITKHSFAGKEVDVLGKGLPKATKMLCALRVEILHERLQACIKKCEAVNKAKVAYL